MQTLFLTGNLAADCEIVPGKEGKEFIRFVVAAKDPAADKEDKPTYYTCRMPKTGVAERLKKGRFVAMVGNLRVSVNIKDDKSYTNLDVWVQSLDVPQLASGE
jgi:single-stranded DNA-binding protein